MIRLALIGDFDRGVSAHAGIDSSLASVQHSAWPDLSWEWWHTSLLPDDPARLPELLGIPDGIWCAPATPYTNMDGALSAIRYARETGTPLLGTCGGFQHIVIEFVRNVLGERDAQHAETHPQAARLAITPLSCELVDVSGMVRGVHGTRFGALYADHGEREEYHCRFGVNAGYLERLEKAGLRCVAFDDASEVRAMEHASHPFFVGTLFQPERRILRAGVSATNGGGNGTAEAESVHPLVVQFVQAASDRRLQRMRAQSA